MFKLYEKIPVISLMINKKIGKLSHEIFNNSKGRIFQR